MTEKLIDWLLEKEDPSVRYFTMLKLLDKTPDELTTERKAIMESELVLDILVRQNPEGYWGGRDPGIRKACEFILEHCWDHESGGFSYTMSKKDGKALSTGVIPCLSGNMVFSLIRLGYLDAPRLQRAIHFITKYQRADDGLEEASGKIPHGWMYDRFEMCFGSHSCFMGVAKALKALTEIPAEKRDAAVTEKIGELAEFFLANHLFKKSHDLGIVSRPGWTKFGFPLMYQTDVLELMDLFARLGIEDDRLHPAIRLIRDKRLDNGTWKLENTFNGKMMFDIEKKGKPSKWNTLRAMNVLKAYGQ